ncbi:MAG: restriction endonuclease, SacI family [Dehalococcoidia bacterium]|nr:restriction endonuclease, SacI family [Dehalococcoidia bacterium]
MPTIIDELAGKCSVVLTNMWDKVQRSFGEETESKDAVIVQTLVDAISRSVNSKTKTYRYVLPTQLTAKIADPSLDCRCVQAGRIRVGSFDARSICDSVIVPFDKANHDVLGGSPEPYVNNPLRVTEVTKEFRERQKDKSGWDDLCFVLEKVETAKDFQFTEQVLEQTLIEVYKRLSTTHISYPIPKRISFRQTQKLLSDYLSVQSGGARIQALTCALLQTVGNKFTVFAEVRSSNINAADAASGQVADIECLDSNGNILLAVEVKDKELTINHIKDKLPNMRSKRVSEILFIAQNGVVKEEETNIEELTSKEYSSGQNIYIFSFSGFAESLIALLGEGGRRTFLENVGNTLDKYGYSIQHKRDWASLLSLI